MSRYRYACECKRNGTANLFVIIDDNRSWRKVKVTDRRTSQNFAGCMRERVDVDYPVVDKIRVVMDNMSTHIASAIYQTFPAAEAHRILQRLEFHYTPKHASWLNMAGIEIGVIRRQCLDRRIDNRELFKTEIRAWEHCSTKSSAQKWPNPIQRLRSTSHNHCDGTLAATWRL